MGEGSGTAGTDRAISVYIRDCTSISETFNIRCRNVLSCPMVHTMISEISISYLKFTKNRHVKVETTKTSVQFST